MTVRFSEELFTLFLFARTFQCPTTGEMENRAVGFHLSTNQNEVHLCYIGSVDAGFLCEMQLDVRCRLREREREEEGPARLDVNSLK